MAPRRAPLAPGTAVIVKDGSPQHNRFGLVLRTPPARVVAGEEVYVVRVAQPGGGWRSSEFRRSAIRLPQGGRARRKRR